MEKAAAFKGFFFLQLGFLQDLQYGVKYKILAAFFLNNARSLTEDKGGALAHLGVFSTLSIKFPLSQ